MAGCHNFLRVEVLLPVDAEPDSIEVAVEYDGRQVTCDFGAEEDPCQSDFFMGFDPGFERGKMPDERSRIIVLDAAPESVRVSVASPDGAHTQVLEPEYEISQPNGPDCGPGCKRAITSLEF